MHFRSFFDEHHRLTETHPRPQFARARSRLWTAHETFYLLEMKNYRSPYTYAEGDKRTGTTRKNACDRETMMKITAVITFIIAQVVLTKYYTSRRSVNIIAQVALTKHHASRRSMNIVVEDRAIRCNRNIEANCLSNKSNTPLSMDLLLI